MWRSAVQVCLGLLSFPPSYVSGSGQLLRRKRNVDWTYIIILIGWQVYSGGLAQLARASALQAEGQRFESVILHQEKEHIDMMEASEETVRVSETQTSKSKEKT